ncbi:MAG: energy transducer TonB [Gammaproteobacteria bacterium]|nr:energy transducer TonB [Gammaproteobacteria bacterium]
MAFCKVRSVLLADYITLHCCLLGHFRCNHVTSRLGSRCVNPSSATTISRCTLERMTIAFPQSDLTVSRVRKTRSMRQKELNDRIQKVIKFYCFNLLVIALLFFSPSLAADESATQEAEQPSERRVEIDSFRGPVLLEHVFPVYPQSRLNEGEESWVHVNFMVDAEGKPYEIVVTDSIGHSSFKNAAIRAVKRWKYQPAIYNGEKIDAGAQKKIVFQISDQPKGASDRFVSLQNALRKAVAEDDKEQADRYLKMLEDDRKHTLYEDAFFNFAKYEYMNKWGNEDQQLDALNRAIAHERTDKYLPADVYSYAMGKRLPLLLKKRDYLTAFVTYEILSRQELDETARSNLEAVGKALKELKDNQNSYDVVATISDAASWNLGLWKDEFWIEDVEGHIVELKLRCHRDMEIIRFEPEVKYKIEQRSGGCFLEVLGDKGTTFRLFQS